MALLVLVWVWGPKTRKNTKKIEILHPKGTSCANVDKERIKLEFGKANFTLEPI
jgi:hypothetical protein